MILLPEARKELAEAIEDAFQANAQGLKAVAADLDATSHFPSNGTILENIDFLIDWASSHDQLRDLLGFARRINPANLALQRVERGSECITKPARKVPVTIGAMANIASDLKSQERISTVKVRLRDLTKRMILVRSYKRVHDIIHSIQVECLFLFEEELVQAEIDYDPISTYHADFQSYLAELDNVRKTDAFSDEMIKADAAWVARHLAPIDLAWKTGIERGCNNSLQKVSRDLGRMTSMSHSKINARLDSTAREMLPTFVDLLDEIAKAVSDDAPDKAVLSDGIARLRRLSYRLLELVSNHSSWQEIDDEMWRISGSLPDISEELTDSWPILEQMSGALSAETLAWAPRLSSAVSRLRAAMESHDPEDIVSGFLRLRKVSRTTFFMVDAKLKDQCEELPLVAQQMEPVLVSFK